MKKLVYFLICISFATQLKAQWDFPTDKYYRNDGLNYLDIFGSGIFSNSFLAGHQIAQVASTFKECDLPTTPNKGLSVYGAAFSYRTFIISGTAGSVTVKIMQANGASLCDNDSINGFNCNASISQFVKQQPGTVIHQETFSLSNATHKIVSEQNNVRFATFSFSGGPITFNANLGAVYMVFDFSAIGDDTIGMTVSQPYLDNDIYIIKDSLCWKKNNNFDLVLLPLIKNDPYVITSKKITTCIEGLPIGSFERYFERKTNNTVSVCSDDTLLLIPTARFGLRDGLSTMSVKQTSSPQLPFVSVVNSYITNNCGGFAPYVDNGFLATPNQSRQYSFDWPDSMYATTNMNLDVTVNFINYPTITTNQNISVCPGNNQLNVNVSGPTNTILWRGATFNDSTIANPIFNAIMDTVLTITAKTNNASCATTKNIQVSVKRPFNQPICMVTVDSSAMHNIIVWEKEANSNVDTFFVFREITTNNYQKIASVAYNNITEFADITANPNQQAYRYRIAVKDLCGNTGALENNNYHNTIHLQNQGNGNFNWNNYTIEGQSTVVASYNFWRDSLGDGNWRNIATVPGTQNTYTDGQFASLPNASYRVEVNWIGGKICNPLLKRSAGYSSSLSNIIRQNTTGISNLPLDAFNCYPNPANNELSINNPSSASLTLAIYNAIGEKVVDVTEIKPGSHKIDISELNSGVYYIKVSENNNTITKKLMVVH